MDALHVVLGVLLQLAGAALFRRTLADWSPWLFVAGLLLINEAHDLWVEQWPERGMQYGEGAKDVLLTLLVPTLLLWLARKRSPLLGAGCDRS